MPLCVVSGCHNSKPKIKSTSNPVSKVRFFYIPKNTVSFNLWKAHIPLRKSSVLTQSSRVCEEHFLPKEIIKDDIFKIDEKEIHFPRKNWKLKEGVYPTQFEALPPTPDIENEVHRKQPAVRKPLGDISNYQEHSKKRNVNKKRVCITSDVPDKPLHVPQETPALEETAQPLTEAPMLALEEQRYLIMDGDQLQLPGEFWRSGVMTANGFCNYYEVLEVGTSVLISKSKIL